MPHSNMEELKNFLKEQVKKENFPIAFSDWHRLEDEEYISDRITILAAEVLRLQVEPDEDQKPALAFSSAIMLVEIMALCVLFAEKIGKEIDEPDFILAEPVDIKITMRYIIFTSVFASNYRIIEIFKTVASVITRLGYDPLKVARAKFLGED